MDLTQLHLPSAQACGLRWDMWTSITGKAMLKLAKDEHQCLVLCLLKASPNCCTCKVVMFPFGWGQKGALAQFCIHQLNSDLNRDKSPLVAVPGTPVNHASHTSTSLTLLLYRYHPLHHIPQTSGT